MNLCCKCKKRPAVVFMSDPTNPNLEPKGFCLVCAKESGIKPINDMLAKMNITDEDIEQMSEQFSDIMSMDDDGNFDLGTAPAFPFLNNIFGSTDDNPENDSRNGKTNNANNTNEKKGKKRFLEQYCTNLTKQAKEGKLDDIIGREDKLYRTIQILSRRSKNNPCLIGEPGVGKTAIAEGLAIKIARGDAPARLLDKEVYLLDLTSLVAGTQFRGQFESRVKGLVSEIKTQGNVILFIDEIHNLVGAGDSSEGSMNAANILKPALSRGEIQVIGATTFKEYRKYIEKDAALERRFQPITIEEPSIAETEKVLLGIKKYYEGYHNVTIPDGLISTVVRLSERYVTDRFLPDKAIDLLDESCATASLANKAIDELYIVNKKIADSQAELDSLLSNVDNPDYEKQAQLKTEIVQLQNTANGLYEPASNNTVTTDDVAKVIELWTGIPASKIKESDIIKLSTLKEELSKEIIGQDRAVDLVVSAVKRSRIKLSNELRPASFIFVGPTGVGKTQLVKALSKQLFDSPETMIRFDMSEFMEKHSVSRLIGAPPGYVGFDEAGQLTEKVRRKPYSVILFDEIEKAHPDVLNILLQILDEGAVTDAQGRKVNFQNTVIVMTSNAGSDKQNVLLGFEKNNYTENESKVKKALSEFLRPEFLARVDEIVVFSPLDKKSLSKISELMLNELKKALSYKNIELIFNDKVCDFIAEKSENSKTGARELRNFIRKNIEDVIVNALIDKGDSGIKTVDLKVVDGKINLDIL